MNQKANMRYQRGLKQQIIVIGQMDNSDGTFESANRVYGSGGVAPTLPTCCGGGHQPKVIKLWKQYSEQTAEQ